MKLKEIAQQYHQWGFSVLPTDDTKLPMGKWKLAQEQPIEPNGNFDNCIGIGFACGKGSGGLEVIDIDSSKQDIGQDVWAEVRAVLKTRNELAKKLVIEKSPSGGKHIFYRCDNYEGNLKLASRPAAESELVISPKEKIKTFLETRGRGGFIKVSPSEGYQLIYGDFSKVQKISNEERDWMIAQMRKLDRMGDEEIKPLPKSIQPKRLGVSPFDDYNNRGDVVQLLEDSGWTYVEQQGKNVRFRRPNCDTSSRTSGDFHTDLRLFHVFTSSTEFEPSKSYNPVQVFTMLNFGFLNKETYAEAAKLLRGLGYGEQDAREDEIEKQIELEKTNNYLAEDDDIDSFLEDVRNDNVVMGVGIGLKSVDEYFVHKPATFNMVGGIANIGKTDWMLWWFTVLSSKHGLKWLIGSMENEAGEIMMTIMQYRMGKQIKKMTASEYQEAKAWARDHFTIFSNKRTYTYKEILDAVKEELRKQPYAGVLIDPHSSLELDVTELKLYGEYRYHYRSATQFRLFTKQTGCSIYLVAHPSTEANKRLKDGFATAPFAADIEFGSMWQNRCDNSITLHRVINHPLNWMITELHVRKIKSKFSGGNITSEPVLFSRHMDCYFTDPFGRNPLQRQVEEDEEAPF